MFNMSLGRMNKFATLAILPGMVLAIMLFATPARDRGEAEPPSSGVLIVANLRGESLTIHNFGNDRATTLSLPGAPHEMVELNGRLYITLGRANRLAEVDPTAPALLRTLVIEGEPHGIAVHDGNLLVSLDTGDAVVTIDPVALRAIGRVETGDTPHVVAVAGDTILVTDTRDHAIRRLGDDPKVSGTGGLPEGLAIAGGYAVTADYESGTVSVFEAATLDFVATIRVGAGPVRVAAIDASHVAVARQGSPEVVVVDLAALAVIKRFEAPDRPDGLCTSPDGVYLAVAGNGTRSAAVFDTATWKLVKVIPAGDGPGSCLWRNRR